MTVKVTVSEAMYYHMEQEARKDGEIIAGRPVVQPLIRRAIKHYLQYRHVSKAELELTDAEYGAARRKA